MSDNTNLTNAVNKLVEQLKKQYGESSGAAGGSRSKNGFSNFNSSLSDASGSLDDLRKELEDAADSAKHSGKSYSELVKIIAKGSDNLGKRTAELGDAYKKHREDLVKTGKFFEAFHDSSIFKKVKGTTHLGKTIQTVQDMHNEAEIAHKHLREYGRTTQKFNVKRLSDITNSEHKKLAVEALRELHPKIDLKQRASDLKASHPNLNSAERLELARTNVLKEFDDAAAGSKNLSENLAVAGGTASKLAKGFGVLTTVAFGVTEIFKAVEETVQAFQASMEKGITGSVGTFFDLQKSSIALGVSYSELSQGLHENYNLVARSGVGGVIDLQKNNRFNLLKTEGTSQAANAATLGIAQNAYLAGVNPANSNAMQKAIDGQIDQYRTLKAITGESIAALAKQTAAVLNSSDSIDLMSGMTKEQRFQYGQDILAEQTRLQTLGMTNQAALQVIDTMNALAKQKPADKLQEAIKFRAIAQSQYGISAADAQKASMVILKGEAAGADAAAAMSRVSKIISGKHNAAQLNIDQNVGGALADQAMYDQLGPVGGMIDKYASLNLNRGLSKDQIAARKQDQQAATGTTDVLSGLDRINSTLSNPILHSIENLGKTVVAAILLTKFSGAVGKIAGRFFGGGGSAALEGAEGVVAGGAAEGAGALGLGALAAGAGSLLGGGIGGAATTWGANKIMDAAGVKQHSLWRVFGDAGAGAAGGALVGSVVPVFGTALGAAGGAAYGLGKGLWDYFSSDSPAAPGGSTSAVLNAPGSVSSDVAGTSVGGNSPQNVLMDIRTGINKLVDISQKHLNIAIDMSNDDGTGTKSTASTVNSNNITNPIPTAAMFTGMIY